MNSATRAAAVKRSCELIEVRQLVEPGKLRCSFCAEAAGALVRTGADRLLEPRCGAHAVEQIRFAASILERLSGPRSAA